MLFAVTLFQREHIPVSLIHYYIYHCGFSANGVECNCKWIVSIVILYIPLSYSFVLRTQYDYDLIIPFSNPTLSKWDQC
jgi:hypothetical protein